MLSPLALVSVNREEAATAWLAAMVKLLALMLAGGAVVTALIETDGTHAAAVASYASITSVSVPAEAPPTYSTVLGCWRSP